MSTDGVLVPASMNRNRSTLRRAPYAVRHRVVVGRIARNDAVTGRTVAWISQAGLFGIHALPSPINELTPASLGMLRVTAGWSPANTGRSCSK